MATQSAVTPEEYLEAECKAAYKSEFYDSRVFPIADPRPRHARISTNFLVRLVSALSSGPCHVFNSDMRLHVPATGLYTYADVSAACAEPVFIHGDTLVNPNLVIETRTHNFFDYRTIPAMREYLLVSQTSRSITHCSRLNATDWSIETIAGTTGVIHLPSLDVQLTFDQIYDRVDSLPV